MVSTVFERYCSPFKSGFWKCGSYNTIKTIKKFDYQNFFVPSFIVCIQYFISVSVDAFWVQRTSIIFHGPQLKYVFYLKSYTKNSSVCLAKLFSSKSCDNGKSLLMS